MAILDANGNPVAEEQPKYATAEQHDELKQILQGLSTTVTALGAAFSAVTADKGSKGEATGPQNPHKEYSEEEMQTALDQNDTMAYTRMVRSNTRHDSWEQEQRISRQVNELQTTGLNSIAGIRQELTVKELPHYTKYQKEIDEYLGQMSPQARMDPKLVKLAHDAVVGAHVQELMNEQHEKLTRQNQGVPNTPGARGQRVYEATPTAEVDLTDDAWDELDYKGRTPDEQARAMGYKSWKDYMEKTKEEAVA